MVNKSFVLFKAACIGVNLVEVCTRLFYCFVIVGNTSIQLPSPFSKTSRLTRSLLLLLKRSAKTTPNDVILESCTMLILFRKF